MITAGFSVCSHVPGTQPGRKVSFSSCCFILFMSNSYPFSFLTQSEDTSILQMLLGMERRDFIILGRYGVFCLIFHFS